MKFFKLILLTILIASQSFAGDNTIVPPTQDHHEILTQDTVMEMGQGYDAEKQISRGTCVGGKITPIGKPISRFSLDSRISEERLSSLLGFEVGGRYRTGVAEFSAAASFVQSSKEDKFSISTIYTADYLFKNRVLDNGGILNAMALKLQDNPKFWRETCGDEYVSQQMLGSQIFISIRIDFDSQDEKQAFSATFNMAGPIASASASVSQSKNRFSRNSTVTVNAMQIGGEVQKLTASVGGEGPNNEGSIAYTKCSLGDLEKCETFLKNAIAYATDPKGGFPSQTDPNAETGSNRGPAILKSFTRSYKEIGVHNEMTYEATKMSENSKAEIQQIFEETFKVKVMADHIKSGYMRLTPGQSDRLEKARAQLILNLNSAVNASETCYQHPRECRTVAAALGPKSNSPTSIKPVSENDLIFYPESFAQYCDKGKSPVATKGLQTTIAAMVDLAKSIDAEQFTLVGKDASIDECAIAETVLTKVTEMDLSKKSITDRELAKATKGTGTQKSKDEKDPKTLAENDIIKKGISDLRPISVLPNLKTLKLSDNAIKDITPLAQLKNLRVLDLGRNQIQDASPLIALPLLRELSLQENSLSDVSYLKALTQLAKLDIRNNNEGIQCPLDVKEKCWMADYKGMSSFVPFNMFPTMNEIYHWYLSTQLVSGDNYLYRIGLFNDYNTWYVNQGDILHTMNHRVGHSATWVNGDILVVGGYGNVTAFDNPNYGKWTGFAVIDPKTGLRRPSFGNLKYSLMFHTATKLKDNRVMIAGGTTFNPTDPNNIVIGGPTLDVQIYSPESSAKLNPGAVGSLVPTVEKLFSRPTNSLKVQRTSHTATLLNDGRVLFVGGRDKVGGYNTAEIFDGFKNIELLNSKLKVGRSHHTATLLKDGTVLIVGGFDKEKATNSVAIFDPKNNQFLEGNPMNEARGGHTATLLPDGRVLIAGGNSSYKNITSIFLPDGEFDMKVAFCKETCLDTAEIYDPKTKEFILVSAKMTHPRVFHSASLWGSNRVLISGGLGDEDAAYTEETWIYSDEIKKANPDFDETPINPAWKNFIPK